MTTKKLRIFWVKPKSTIIFLVKNSVNLLFNLRQNSLVLYYREAFIGEARTVKDLISSTRAALQNYFRTSMRFKLPL